MRSDGMATFAECALTAQPALWRRLRDSIGACSCAGGGSAYESASESASERARPPVRACSLANVQHPSPVPVKLWQGRAKSRCRCGRGEPSPGAGVARQCACLPESTSHVANVDGSPMYGFRAPRVPARCPAWADRSVVRPVPATPPGAPRFVSSRRSSSSLRCATKAVPVQMSAAVRPVPVQMWQTRKQ